MVSTRSFRHAVCILAMLALCGLTGCTGGSPQDEYQKIAWEYDHGNYAKVKQLAKKIPKEHPRWMEIQVLLGRSESVSRGPRFGIPYLESVPRDQSSASYDAARTLAENYGRMGALSKAADNLRYYLEHGDTEEPAHQSMSRILTQSGLHEEKEEHLLWILKRAILKLHRIEVEQLISLSIPERRGNHYSQLKVFSQAYPHDPYVNLGLAQEEVHELQLDAARQRLKRLVEAAPDLPEAQALLGELLIDEGDSALRDWNSHLPVSVRKHPGVWYVRGLWAARLKNPQVACRCFWETLRTRPHDRRANYQLGVNLATLNPAAAAAFAQRAADLKEYADSAERVMINRGRDREMVIRIVESLHQMGRLWESKAWARLVTEMLGPSDPFSQQLDKKFEVTDSTPRFSPEGDLTRAFDLSQYPDFDSLTLPEPGVSEPSTAPLSRIRFEDEAVARGLQFTYFQSPDTKTNGVRIFESTGGGVSVLDFDQDGEPDLYLPQGEPWLPGQERPAPAPVYRDALFRLSAGRYSDVTTQAGLAVEDGYGQGCSAGDFNNDGFVDLYVANIGMNQLLMNNGDGTFSDVTSQSGLVGQDWTSSCLIADLDADGNPDLYDVNYLQGQGMFQTECSSNRCSVRNFAGCPDCVQLSNGDGTFREILDATPKENAKGLGIIAMYLSDEPQPSLFIANDQVPNHFLRPQKDGKYEDHALLSGLALNMNGQPTACMGVASGDLNRDGLVDLFVTNFEGEANNLYLQTTRGFFEDSIAGSGLMTAGIPYVGWGTQFLDADNNGEFDLVVANGHVADFSEQGIQSLMPSQVFRNLGKGKFQHVPESEAGTLFERKVLGRGLALLDWNRDGKIDFVQTNIAAPVMLATNTSETTGHWISVQLHGSRLSRDALGATVTLQQNGQTLSQQLLGGNGYNVTNQRRLSFGLGASDSPVDITISWQGGATSTFRQVPVDCTLEASEEISSATLRTAHGLLSSHSGN